MNAPSVEQGSREIGLGAEAAGAVLPAVHPLTSLAARRAVLEPHRLAATTEAAARALLRQGEATNTRLSYSSAMRYWCAWYAARYGQALALPVPVPVVVQFIVDHAARRPDGESAFEDTSSSVETAAEGERSGDRTVPAAGRATPKRLQKRRVLTDLVTELPEDVDAALVTGGFKGKAGPPALATLVHRIAVLSKAHQMAKAGRTGHSGFEGALASPAAGRRRQEEGGSASQAMPEPVGAEDARLVNPCADPLVRELLARTRRAYAQRGVRQNKQRALTKDPLQQLLTTCDDSPKGIRDRALLLFAWTTGGRRRSEVTSARIEHLQKVEEGAYVFTLGHTKTNQSGEFRPEDVKPLVGSAAVAMQDWLAILAKDGIKEGPIFRRIRRGGHVGEPLAPAAVRDVVKERCRAAGIEAEGFSAHSIRSGFITEAGRQAIPLAETMALTGHQSVASVVGYFRMPPTKHSLAVSSPPARTERTHA